MTRVAIEGNLADVRQALEENGFEVIPLHRENLSQCDCCVISGQDMDVVSAQDAQVQVPVINASVMSPEQVVEMVRAHTQ